CACISMASTARAIALFLHSLFDRGRQHHLEGAALTGRAAYSNRALIAAHESLHGREAHPASSEFRTEERVEDLRLRLLVHSAAGIRNFQGDQRHTRGNGLFEVLFTRAAIGSG